MDNRSLSHTRWKCQYHIVFIPKYRKRILYGRLREDIKEINRDDLMEAPAEYSVAAKPSVRKNGNHLSG